MLPTAAAAPANRALALWVERVRPDVGHPLCERMQVCYDELLNAATAPGRRVRLHGRGGGQQSYLARQGQAQGGWCYCLRQLWGVL